MKTIIKYTVLSFALIAPCLFLGSCEDMLDTDSSRVAFEEDHQLNSPNDSLYSAIGILSQFQKLGERYVLFGELRGDLMTVSDDASFSLKEINNFNLSAENVYHDKKDYYSVINNCNYAIARMDTSITVHNRQVMMPEFVAIKGIRAWTYFQLAQIYGSVTYLTEPILDYESALKSHSTVSIDNLVPMLIDDLTPYAGMRTPDYGYIDGQASSQFFFPIYMLLGDLYLYQNNYHQAATMYHKLMIEKEYYLSSAYSSFWVTATRDNIATNHINSYEEEVITNLAYSSIPKDYHSNLVNLTYNDVASLLPVENFVDQMSIKTHFFSSRQDGPINAYLEGDLRGDIKFANSNTAFIGDAYLTTTLIDGSSKTLISRFFNASTSDYSIPVEENNGLLSNAKILTTIPLYRHPHLYLRFAEAVNRAGKPTLAFAVLKNGLNENTISNPAIVSPAELEGGEQYLNFPYTEMNVGTASRGCGRGIASDKAVYVIPDFTQDDIAAAKNDSIEWVEAMILEEMAAETSFEGNRFFDLLRISRHRDNHPAFMAEQVSKKYEDSEAMKNKLMNLSNWFLK